MARSILWLRRDLRRADHPALTAAAADGDVLPLYVLDPRTARRPHRAAALGRALAALQDSYEGALVIRTGTAEQIVPTVAHEVAAVAVHVTQDFTPAGRAVDRSVADALDGTPLVTTSTPYLVAPGMVRNRSGAPYRVFTPFSRAWREQPVEAPAVEPPQLRFARGVDSEPLPTPPPSPEQTELPVTEAEAAHRWAQFLRHGLDDYDEGRDRPDLAATSRLSTALALGTIHPRTLLASLGGRDDPGAQRFVTELAWREFYADVTWHHPGSTVTDFNPLGIEYADPQDPEVAPDVDAWRQGRTGYPLVDAGQRELAATGWMHNRVRMVSASFLTKHLNVWWRVGADHFAAQLADHDVASNSHGWQWVAGTGTDASPYFRVFNPVTQGLKFDPDGNYVRRWVPELRHLPGAAAHRPWLAADGYRHGYPSPVVDHNEARSAALARYQSRTKPVTSG